MSSINIVLYNNKSIQIGHPKKKLNKMEGVHAN